MSGRYRFFSFYPRVPQLVARYVSLYVACRSRENARSDPPLKKKIQILFLGRDFINPYLFRENCFQFPRFCYLVSRVLLRSADLMD